MTMVFARSWWTMLRLRRASLCLAILSLLAIGYLGNGLRALDAIR